MTAPARHLDHLRAERLHKLVQQRFAALAGDRRRRKAYAGLVQGLAQQLRHNGLRQTLDYLALLAHAEGRKDPAARDLLDDWLISATGTEFGWHLQHHIVGFAAPTDRSQYRDASRLALREADWLRRFVQSEFEGLPTGTEALVDENGNAAAVA